MQFVREQIGNLDIIAAGDQCRLYTKVVPNIPRGQTEYHVIYVFYIDESHDYQQSDLATYHPQAQQVVETLTDYSDVGDVEQYLKQNGALDADDVSDLLSS